MFQILVRRFYVNYKFLVRVRLIRVLFLKTVVSFSKIFGLLFGNLRCGVFGCHLVRIVIARHCLRNASKLLGDDTCGLESIPLVPPLIIDELLLRSLLGGAILIHDHKLSLFYLIHRNLRLILIVLDALALVKLDQTLLRRI